MIKILSKRDEGKRLFKVELNDEPSLNIANDNSLTVQPRSFDGKSCQLVVSRDVSLLVRHDKLQNDYDLI